MSFMKSVEEMLEEASREATRKRDKPNSKYGWFSGLPEVNEPVECVMVLKKLNQAIDLMYELSDSAYYLDHIWNASTMQKDDLKEIGADEDYFDGVANKLEQLRCILFGRNLNFKELYNQLYGDLLCHEVYWHEFYEDWAMKLQRENDKLKKENKNG